MQRKPNKFYALLENYFDRCVNIVKKHYNMNINFKFENCIH